MCATNLLQRLIILLVGFYHATSYALIPEHITSFTKHSPIQENRIKISAPDIAENGSVVSVGIEQVLLHGDGIYVKKVWFFDHFRPDALASFELVPPARATELATRFRLAGSSEVYVVAELSDGTFISGQKYVKVTIGGCGGGGPVTSSTGYNYVAPTLSQIRQPTQHWQNTERYQEIKNNGVVICSQQPLSTFSIDVDTGSYSNVRRFVMQEGRLPVRDAVRIEEMINYFDYEYPLPDKKQAPFSVTTEVGPNPWNSKSHLLHIGLKGYAEQKQHIPPANLVFLIDVSGSMQSANKLGLLVASLKALVREMRAEDSISIVVYAGRTAVLLEPTSGNQKEVILATLGQLSAGGSTNGGAGIHLAYSMARKAFKEGGINRVILATDGDFNVGIVDRNQLIEIVKRQRESGISLTTLGFGTGNYNEHLMEQLADHGNGNYAYIDNFQEAKKVLVEQFSGTLFTIAKDVKIQVEFNPAVVAEYRLIGYENRQLRTEDFRNDKVDAGDIGAGHTVTALYEITFAGSEVRRTPVLRYAVAENMTDSRGVMGDEIAMVQLRYKLPSEDHGRELRSIVKRTNMAAQLSGTSDNYRFSAAVAALGQWLRGGEMLNDMSLIEIKSLAFSASGSDPRGYRHEFIKMVEAVESM